MVVDFMSALALTSIGGAHYPRHAVLRQEKPTLVAPLVTASRATARRPFCLQR
jgi:hypothetical protein